MTRLTDPRMFPKILEFELFGRSLAFNSYGLLIGIGLVLWMNLVRREANRLGLDRLRDGLTTTSIALIAAAYVGGKALFYLTLTDGERTDDPGSGFVFYGSMLAVIPTLIWRARVAGVSTLLALDVFVTPAGLMHAFGRLGCLMAGCCYGHRCDLPWALTFHDGVGLKGVPIHPVQVYEVVGLLALFAVVWFVIRPRKRFEGQIAFFYLAGYAVLRSVTEAFRGDPDRRFVFSDVEPRPGDPPVGMSTSTFISILVAIVLVVTFVLLQRSGRLRRVDPD